MKESSKNILLRMVVLLLVLCISSVLVLDGAYASTEDTDQARSPSFSRQEIVDPNLDWIFLGTGNITEQQGDRSTDIESADYSSDGNTLNATLWLYFPFRVNPSLLNEEINYGMLIDSDFDLTTGYRGNDYKFEISWNNQSKQWTQLLEKWSFSGDVQTLSNMTIPYSSFSEMGSHYVQLSLDLNDIGSPPNYGLLFYSSVIKEGSLMIDPTQPSFVPPFSGVITVSPNTIDLRAGQKKTVKVDINSTQGYELTANLSALSQSSDIIAQFKTDTLTISPTGITSTPMDVNSSDMIVAGTYTVVVQANLTLNRSMALPFNSGDSTNSFPSMFPFPAFITQTKLDIISLPPLSIIEQFGNTISTVALISILALSILFSAMPSILPTKLRHGIILQHNDILHMDIGIIAGVLIFLSLEGFEGSEETQITFITANIVFPFAISAVATLANKNNFGTRLMVAGFINLMISIILIAIMKL